MEADTLVLGIGNVLWADEGFGVRAVAALNEGWRFPECVTLVDGGTQRRSFTWLDDRVDGLMRIIENRGGACQGEILNLGNPENEASIRELGERLAAL